MTQNNINIGSGYIWNLHLNLDFIGVRSWAKQIINRKFHLHQTKMHGRSFIKANVKEMYKDMISITTSVVVFSVLYR